MILKKDEVPQHDYPLNREEYEAEMVKEKLKRKAENSPKQQLCTNFAKGITLERAISLLPERENFKKILNDW